MRSLARLPRSQALAFGLLAQKTDKNNCVHDPVRDAPASRRKSWGRNRRLAGRPRRRCRIGLFGVTRLTDGGRHSKRRRLLSMTLCGPP